MMNWKKEKSPARARQDGGGKQLAAFTFCLTRKNSLVLVKTRPCVHAYGVSGYFVFFCGFSKALKLAAAVSRFQLKESWWDEPQLTENAADWSLATDHDFLLLCCCFFSLFFGRVVMKTAPENAVPWCRLLTPASVTRRKTSRSGINTLKIILCSRRQRGAERAAQKNTVDRPQRPWNTTDPRTMNTPLAINHLQVFLLRRSVRTPPRIHSATRPEETFSFLPHNTEETFRRKSSIECQSRKSSWEKSLKTEIV